MFDPHGYEYSDTKVVIFIQPVYCKPFLLNLPVISVKMMQRETNRLILNIFLLCPP